MLRFFLREGVQWRELRASSDRASGSTVRRRLTEWSATALWRRVHAVLIHMVRSGPPHGSGLGQVRCIVEHANAWLLADKRLDRRHDGLGVIVNALLTAASISVVATRLVEF